ncbi:MAG: hypothetical protein E5Y51_03835 [Mesorhizobium sp.]|nr:MAG: hypothetical protein E5Y51_03835 [Mesorhizobium sp.]
MTFQAMLAARAYKEGKAQRSALFRHRALANDPLCIVAWQLGAEPYSVGAIACGKKSSGYSLHVPGYPLDRQLLFMALIEFGREFCTLFEAPANGPCEFVDHFGDTLAVPTQLPQVVVPNVETIGLIGRLGRRLAYLPTDGEHAADPILPRLGRHLMWLAEQANMPGQQIILSVTDLLASHYVTAMSPYELGSLTALDAWIEPGRGKSGFHAAEAAERQAVGPTPDPLDGERIYDLMKQFNEARAGSRDPAVVDRCAQPLRRMYDDMVKDTWDLVWKALDRERQRPEAASVGRRVRDDGVSYASHLAWLNGPAEGRRRTRLNARMAAMRLNEYERAQAALVAEEAIDDPLRMVPVLLAGQAIAGDVIRSDPNRRELINGRFCKRPDIVVRAAEPCVMPLGTEVWWTLASKGREWVVTSIVPNGIGSDVTLVLQTNRMPEAGLPRLHQRVCLSQLNTLARYETHLPQDIPWTHRPKEPPSTTDLESEAA